MFIKYRTDALEGRRGEGGGGGREMKNEDLEGRRAVVLNNISLNPYMVDKKFLIS